MSNVEKPRQDTFKEAFMAMNDAVFIADQTTGNLLECNRAAEKLLKRTRDEIIGQSQAIIHPPDRVEYYKTVFEKHAIDGGGYCVETEIMNSEGEVSWTSINASIINYENKPALLGIFRDITMTKALESEILKNRERLSLATQGTGIGIWDYDFVSDTLTWDRQMFKLFGVKPVSFKGKFSDWSDCVVPEALPKAVAEFQAAARGEKEFNTEFPILLPDKSVRHIAGAATFVQDENGATVRAVGVNYDITERVNNHNALQSAKTEWERTFDTVPDMISILDNNFNIVRLNKAFAMRMNKKPSECIGKKCFMFNHMNHKKHENCPFVKCFLDGKTHTSEIEESQLGVVYEVTASPIKNSEGEITGCVHIARDITEMKKMQKGMVEAERMSAVGVLIAGIAHEYNNAITGVLGYLQLLAMNTDIAEKQHKQIEKALSGANRVADLTRNLMSFTDDDYSKVSTFSLHSVIDKAVALAESDMLEDNINLTTDIKSSAYVEGSAKEIGQVVLHLITNASHSLLGRDIKNIHIEAGVEKKQAFFIITDSGLGIHKNDLPNIFLPFFTRKGEKAELNSPLEHVRGTGLGLSLCHKIIEKHGGKIEVESSLDKGSCFTVYLPSVEQPVETEKQVISSGMSAEVNSNVLIVDDDEDVVDYMKVLLKSLAVNLTIFNNAEDALELLKKERYALALVDLIMPGMSGEQLITEIRKLPKSSQPEIAVITGWSKPSKLEEISNLGINHIIKKPFRAEEVIDLVKMFTTLNK
ncbi:MAG: hybrid sensor histidine kinase/response regulator [Planctomycetota bacterium]|jgi:PAS domain S-box-containing protein